jgi:glycosyltransferase involved in cell wall biosynthesis
MNKKISYKILYIPGWFPTKENPYSAVFVKKHVRAIALYNKVILVYASSGKVEKILKINHLNGDDNIETFEIIVNKRIPSFVNKMIKMLGVIFTSIKVIIKNEVDLINTCSILSIVGISAFIISKISKLPIITNEHWSGYIRKNPVVRRVIIKTLGKFLLRNVNMVCPVSNYMANAINLLGVNREKIFVIPNVVEISFNRLNKADYKEIKILLFIGLNFKVKGLHFLLNALRLLKSRRSDFLLEVIGGIDAEELQCYKQMTKDMGLENNVLFLGVKTENEICKYIERCDFGVQPSLYETFGISVLEFIGNGKPVITTDIPPINELVPRNYGIFVPPGDIESLSNAINIMLDTYYKFPTLEMVNYVKNHFSYESIGTLFTKVYSLIVK